MVVVIRELQAHVGIACLMILTRNCLLITVSHQHGTYVVYAIEGAVIIKVRIECDGLVVGRTRDILHTRLLIHRAIVVKTYDDILAIEVCPSWLEGSVSIIKRCGIERSIVDGHHRVEAQALEYR